jgi:hypothetical protein
MYDIDLDDLDEASNLGGDIDIPNNQPEKRQHKYDGVSVFLGASMFICAIALVGVIISGVLSWSSGSHADSTLFAAATNNTVTPHISSSNVESVALPDPTDPPVTISVTSDDLYAAYDSNEIAADKKYKDRLLSVTGKVSGVDQSFGGYYVTLSTGQYEIFSVQCFFDSTSEDEIAAIEKYQNIVIKGYCSGWNGNITLNDCSIDYDQTKEIQSVVSSVSLKSYDRLNEGITYAQACEVLGMRGTLSDEYKIMDSTYQTFEWPGNANMSSMTATFENGKLSSKFQIGLE